MTEKELRARVYKAWSAGQHYEILDTNGLCLNIHEPALAPFDELPKKLKEETLEKFTIEGLKEFLEQNNSELYKELNAHQQDKQEQILRKARAHCIFAIDFDFSDIDMINLTAEELATKDDKKWPPLKTSLFSSHWIEAVNYALHNPKKPGRKKGSLAEISNVGSMLWTPSEKTFANALTINKNKTTFIAPVAEDISKLKENGTIETLKPGSKEIQEYDQGFVNAVYSTMAKAGEPTITISIPQFCADIHRDYNDDEFLGKLSALQNNYVGSLSGKQRQILNISSIDKESRRVTISSYYMFDLQNAMIEKSTEFKKNGEPYLKPYHNKLVKSSIVGAKNKPAAEIVAVITTHIVTMGYRPQSKTYKGKGKIFKDPGLCVYRKSVKEIIAECPQFKDKLDSYTNNRIKNQALKRAFNGAYEYLDKYTVCKDYYIDFKIVQAPRPTMNSLPDDQILITFRGINGDYKEQ